MPSNPEVVVTGAGVVTPLGSTLASYWHSLRSETSAIQRIDIDEAESNACWYAAKVKDYNAKDYVQPKKSMKLICEEIQFAFGAAIMACNDANIKSGSIDPDRLSICFGGEMLYSESKELVPLIRLCTEDGVIDHAKWGHLFGSNIYPLWMLKSLPNMAACHVGIALDSRGPINTITTDETASLMALHEAYMTIQRGAADVVVVGASSSYISPTRLLQVPAEHYCCNRLEATTAIRPFDVNRSGMAHGEGAGCIVIESAQHARDRSAKPLAKLLSVSSTFHRPEVYRSGSARSITTALGQALERANLSASKLDHVNTPAGGSVSLDLAISEGVADVDEGLNLVSVQGGMGNLGVASGLVELIASIVAANEEQASPSTLNCSEPDKQLRCNVLHDPSRKLAQPYFAKLSHTPHGQSAAAVFQVFT
jgi:3-oxoacyl-[acyl-carrier-protein] synthase II